MGEKCPQCDYVQQHGDFAFRGFARNKYDQVIGSNMHCAKCHHEWVHVDTDAGTIPLPSLVLFMFPFVFLLIIIVQALSG